LANKLYVLPEKLDDEVARIKLASLKVGIDTLSPEQDAYLHQA